MLFINESLCLFNVFDDQPRSSLRQGACSPHHSPTIFFYCMISKLWHSRKAEVWFFSNVESLFASKGFIILDVQSSQKHSRLILHAIHFHWLWIDTGVSFCKLFDFLFSGDFLTDSCTIENELVVGIYHI